MTKICSNCGRENHTDELYCLECGEEIIVEKEYVVCPTCGLSNSVSSKKCEGCLELINPESKLIISEDTYKKTDTSKTKKTKKKRSQSKRKYNKAGKITITVCLLSIAIIASLFIFSIVQTNRVYLSSSEGIYYITKDNNLSIVNNINKNILVFDNVSEDVSVQLFDNRGYIYDKKVLYKYQGSKVTKIASDVISYKIDDTTRNVLYLTSDAESVSGDLYLYDGENTKRIDAKVEKERFCFGITKDEIYYVTDVTEEESLGLLLLKRKNEAPIELAEDVYMPVFSKASDSVYFTRENILLDYKYNLYYATTERVTEVLRNVVTAITSPYTDDFLLIQQKNNSFNIFRVKNEDKEVIEKNVLNVGLYDFESQLRTLEQVNNKNIHLFYSNQDEAVSYYDTESKKTTNLTVAIDVFSVSRDLKTLYYFYEDELSKAIFNKGSVKESISLASQVESILISNSGKALVYKKSNMTTYLLKNNMTYEIDNDIKEIMISKDDNYVVYKKNDHNLYSFKLGANESVLVDEKVSSIYLIDNVVYSVSDGLLNSYKLGNYASNKIVNEVHVVKPLK